MVSTAVYIYAYDVYSIHIQHFKDTLFWDLSMTSLDMQDRIIKECKTFQIEYAAELVAVEMAVLPNVYVWAQDYSNLCAVSAVIVKYFPGINI